MHAILSLYCLSAMAAMRRVGDLQDCNALATEEGESEKFRVLRVCSEFSVKTHNVSCMNCTPFYRLSAWGEYGGCAEQAEPEQQNLD